MVPARRASAPPDAAPNGVPRAIAGRWAPARPADALLLDAGPRQALVLVRSIGRSGRRAEVLLAEGTEPVRASRFTAASHPPAGDVVERAIEVLRDHPALVLHPLLDATIEAVRARRGDLAAHGAIALAPEDALAVAVDKTATLALARRLGVAVPAGVVVRDPADAPAAVAALGTPVVVKPARSWTGGDRHIPVAARDGEDARRAVDRITAAGGVALVQEWLPGRREAISLVRCDGRPRAVFAQVAHRMAPSLGGSSVLRESIAPPADALAAADALTAAIGLEGYSEVEFRRDRRGRPVLMEINPRLSASVELAVRAGLDMPLLHHLWAAGEPLPAAPRYRLGTRMRWLGGDVSRLAESVRRRGRPDVPRPGRAARDLLTGFAHPQDYLARDDPGPALRALAGKAADYARRSGALT